MREFAYLGKSDKSAEEHYANRLRNLAVHEHNVKVLKESRGHLIVARLSRESACNSYLPCEYCWCYLARSNHSRHYCKGKSEWEQKFNKQDLPFTADASFLLPTSSNGYDELKEMLDGMTDGNVKLVAQSEQLIREYGAKLLCIGFADDSVKSKLRLLARFLLEIRKLTGLCSATLTECISPPNFHRCTQAAELLVGCDPETLSYRKSTSLKIRNILRQLSKLLKRDAIDRRDEHTVNDMDSFAELCVTDWKCPEKQTVNVDVENDSD